MKYLLIMLLLTSPAMAYNKPCIAYPVKSCVPNTLVKNAQGKEKVCVWNGHHRGVACQVSNYEGDGYEWHDEGGNPVEPKPIAWQPLPAAPKLDDEVNNDK